jgi:hypothetical protein
MRSRLESVRETTREALRGMLSQLGVRFLGYVVRSLQVVLTKGFELHVLGHAVHDFLQHLAGHLKPGDLDYLVADLHLLFPEHLSVLLDDEFTSLDLSGLVSSKANKTRDEHVTQVGHLCPRLKEINLRRAVRITNFSLSESIAKCLQVRVVFRVPCRVSCRVPCATQPGLNWG